MDTSVHSLLVNFVSGEKSKKAFYRNKLRIGLMKHDLILKRKIGQDNALKDYTDSIL